VLVEVKAAGINPIDTYIRQGGFRVLPPVPAILGKEIAGVVKSTGRNVKKFKVFTDTSLTPYSGRKF